jgi:uncharacterized ParB-like nuclease family protein
LKKMLSIDAIRLDFQPEECLIEETVQQYVAQLLEGKRIKPVRVRFDGQDYFLEDGFHSLEAKRRAGHATIEAQVRPGTLTEMEAEFREYLTHLKRSLAMDAEKGVAGRTKGALRRNVGRRFKHPQKPREEEKNVTNNAEARIEAQARRAAKKVGLRAIKSRRQVSLDNFGEFCLVDENTNFVIEGVRFNLTADEVIEYCNGL